jgi:hypothetical protein
MRTKINITSEIISPLGNLELFQEQPTRNTYYTTSKKNRMKMLSIMPEKKRNPFG